MCIYNIWAPEYILKVAYTNITHSTYNMKKIEEIKFFVENFIFLYYISHTVSKNSQLKTIDFKFICVNAIGTYIARKYNINEPTHNTWI